MFFLILCVLFIICYSSLVGVCWFLCLKLCLFTAYGCENVQILLHFSKMLILHRCDLSCHVGVTAVLWLQESCCFNLASGNRLVEPPTFWLDHDLLWLLQHWLLANLVCFLIMQQRGFACKIQTCFFFSDINKLGRCCVGVALLLGLTFDKLRFKVVQTSCPVLNI